MKNFWRAWSWVAIQMLLLAALIFWPSHPLWATPRAWQAFATLWKAAGLLFLGIAALGLGRSLTPSPLPKSDATLQTGGMYHYVRHPIYSGVLLWAAGVAFNSPDLVRGILFVALCAFFWTKARFEERQLARHFANYAAYARQTPMFVPFWRRRA